MDQLVNFGPITAGIIIYQDFYSLIGNSQCKNQIYKYDGTSERRGGHAVVIVGYGYENNKYYWLAQNSWGANFCDNGFVKIEFGELEIENVAFSEPYIESESTSNDDISAKMTLEDDCRITYSTESNDYENSFELNFDNDNSKENNNFYYQCGKDPAVKENSGICSYNYECLNAEKGNFRFKNSSMLKTNNKLTLDFSSFNQNQFYFYGADFIDSIYTETDTFYVTQSGSGITLIFSSFSGVEKLWATSPMNIFCINFLSNPFLTKSSTVTVPLFISFFTTAALRRLWSSANFSRKSSFVIFFSLINRSIVSNILLSF
jgi:hypothetical protein